MAIDNLITGVSGGAGAIALVKLVDLCIAFVNSKRERPFIERRKSDKGSTRCSDHSAVCSKIEMMHEEIKEINKTAQEIQVTVATLVGRFDQLTR